MPGEMGGETVIWRYVVEHGRLCGLADFLHQMCKSIRRNADSDEFGRTRGTAVVLVRSGYAIGTVFPPDRLYPFACFPFQDGSATQVIIANHCSTVI
jgi:hypothetical protein